MHFWNKFREFSYIFWCCFFTTLSDLIFNVFASILVVFVEYFLSLFRASLKCAGRGSRCSPSLSRHYLEASVFTIFCIDFRTHVPTPIFHFFIDFDFSFLKSSLSQFQNLKKYYVTKRITCCRRRSSTR